MAYLFKANYTADKWQGYVFTLSIRISTLGHAMMLHVATSRLPRQLRRGLVKGKRGINLPSLSLLKDLL